MIPSDTQAASLDLNPQKTRILAQLLLLNDITDINRVQQEIARSGKGNIDSERREP